MSIPANHPRPRRGKAFISIVIGTAALVCYIVMLRIYVPRLSQFNRVPDSPAIQGEAMLMAVAGDAVMCVIGIANVIGILLAASRLRPTLPSGEKRLAVIAIALNVLPWLTFGLGMSWPPLVQFLGCGLACS